MKKIKFLVATLFIVAFVTGLNAQVTRSSMMNSKTQSEVAGIHGNFMPVDKAYGCGPGALISSYPDPGNNAHTSCSEANYVVYQSFSGVGADITGLTVWGLQLWHNGSSWQTCVSNPMPLTITFYQDNAGAPGTQVYTENVNLVPVNSGETLLGYTVWEFNYIPTTPVSLANGWFSVQATGTGCWILLITNENASAHGAAIQFDGTTNTPLAYPIGFCLDVDAGSCPFPHTLAVSNVTMTTADFSWVEAGTASAWDIEIGTAGFTPTGVPTYAGVTTNPYQLTGLTLGTSYDVYVRAFCNPDSSIWVGPLTFSTPNCDPADQCIYTFEMSDSWGDGWNGASVEIIENGVQIASITILNGSAASESIALCDGATVQLSWTSGSYDEECGLNVLNPDLVAIYSFTEGNAPAAGLFHTFTVACPACPAPTALNVQNITLTSADLAWTAGGAETSWNLEWGPYGFTPGSGTLVSATTNNPYSLSGLTAATQYSFYVQAICATENSTWVGPFTFATECPPHTTFPWSEGFESAAFPPLCWKSYDMDGDGHFWDFRNDPTNWTTHSGDYVAVSASWISDPLTPDNWLITPQFTIDAADYVLSLWYAAQDPAYPADKFSVLISTASADTADFDEVFTTVISSDIYTEVALPLAAYNGQNIYIAIRHWDCTDMFFMKLDDVSITNSAGLNISVIPSMNVYPNPSTDIVYISEKANVEIFTIDGQLVGSYSDTYKIDVTGLNAGLYIFKVYTQGKVHSAKVNVVR